MNSLENTGTLGNPPVSEDVKTSSQETDSGLWTTERVAQYLHVSLKTVFRDCALDANVLLVHSHELWDIGVTLLGSVSKEHGNSSQEGRYLS